MSNHTSPAFQEYPHELKNICGINEILPKSCALSGSLPAISLPSVSGCSKVRIQRVRMYPNGDLQTFKMVRFDDTFPHVRVLKKTPGVPTNGRRVEKLGAPERCPPPGCHHRSHPTRFGLDAGCRHSGVHREPSRRGQIESRGCPFYRTVRRAYPFPSYLMSQKA